MKSDTLTDGIEFHVKTQVDGKPPYLIMQVRGWSMYLAVLFEIHTPPVHLWKVVSNDFHRWRVNFTSIKLCEWTWHHNTFYLCSIISTELGYIFTTIWNRLPPCKVMSIFILKVGVSLAYWTLLSRIATLSCDGFRQNVAQKVWITDRVAQIKLIHVKITLPPVEDLSFTVGVLEVIKCAFTFSSEIRQIQCTRTEFWCVQCPKPTGLSALDKHQIQASALDLSYFTSKSKCKFINLIHTQQKNKIICSCSWKIINEMVLKCH